MRLALLTTLLCFGTLSAQFVDTSTDLKDLPRVADGFEISLFARDPLVRNPCSLAFDARGRMFVGMGPQYRNPTPQTPPDSVVIVQDTDGDGSADKTHTFATGFNCIQGLAWHGRDLWVANAPDLTVVRDFDGDDVADEYVRIFTDLGNIEHGLHGLDWAPDGRLYMSKGNSKGVVIRDWKRDEPDRIAPKPFRDLWGVPGPADAPAFPPTKTFTRETYRSTYQDPRDDWGRMGGILRCDDMGANLEIVSRGLRNPYDIALDHGFDWLGTDQDQNEGDRIIMPFFGADFGWSHAWSPHWTGENHPPTAPISGPVFSGSGTGIVFADSPAWPAKFRGVFIINDWLLKSTHVYRPAWDGALMQPQGGKWEDFIIGKGALYRPVDMEFGADGALYILGWGRGYGVEHDKEGHMTNEGRIFRVMPKGAASLPPLPARKFSEMSVAELVAEFSSVLPVRRIDAQDELVRRGRPVQPDITSAFDGADLMKERETWTLWTLARSEMGDEFFAKRASEPSLNVRIQALRILGHRKSPLLESVLDAALADPEPRIRFAAVQAVHQARMTSAADRLVAHSGIERDRVTYDATWRALRDLLSAERLRPLLKDERPGIRAAALLALLDRRAIPKEELQPFASDSDSSVKLVAMLGLGRGAKPGAVTAIAPAFPIATNIVAESKMDYSIGTMAAGQPSYTDRPFVFKRVPQLLDGAFIIRTANADDASRGESFLTFDLALDSTVMVAHDVRIRERPKWLQGFSDTDLTVTTSDTTFRLWSRSFPAGRVTLGGNLAGPVRGGKAHYFVAVQASPPPARGMLTGEAESLAALKGANARRGEALFFLSANCAMCHRVGGRGTNFGPDLSNLGDRMEAKYIVQSMLDPNAVITEGFATHVVEADGKSYSGILLATGGTLKLGLHGGSTVEIPADRITKHETFAISPMPPQAALHPPQDVADITAWLLTQKAGAARSPAEPAIPATPAAPVAAPLPVGEGIRFDLRADRIVIAHSGRPLADYVFRDAKILRPHFANVHTLDGLKVTRNHPPIAGVDEGDHADMHPGIWLGFGDINGSDFWRNKARIEHVKFTESPALRDGALTFTEETRLLAATGDPIANLTNRCVLKVTASGLLITWEAEFRAGERQVTFGDQEEMGFGARVATALIEKKGGVVSSSNGQRSAAGTWGQPADWCDYSGSLPGRPCGITLMASPKNFRGSWWHNRDYGVFVANPFGRAAMKQGDRSAVTVKPGESLTLRFGAMIHCGAAYDAAAAYREFAAQ